MTRLIYINKKKCYYKVQSFQWNTLYIWVYKFEWIFAKILLIDNPTQSQDYVYNIHIFNNIYIKKKNKD